MVYKLTKDENGNVRDKDGVRYYLSECGVAYTPQGVNYGYTPFDSREACLAAWELTELTEEEMFPQPELPEEMIDLPTEEEQI